MALPPTVSLAGTASGFESLIQVSARLRIPVGRLLSLGSRARCSDHLGGDGVHRAKNAATAEVALFLR